MNKKGNKKKIVQVLAKTFETKEKNHLLSTWTKFLRGSTFVFLLANAFVSTNLSLNVFQMMMMTKLETHNLRC